MAQPVPLGNLKPSASVPGSLRAASNEMAGWSYANCQKSGIKLRVPISPQKEFNEGDVVIMKPSGITPYLVIKQMGTQVICRHFNFYGSGRYRDFQDFFFQAEHLNLSQNLVHLAHIERGKKAADKAKKSIGKGSKVRLTGGTYGVMVQPYSSADGCFGVEVDGELRRVPFEDLRIA